MTWCLESDTLQFRIVVDGKPCTRRGILSTVSSIFDPLGLVGPYMLEGKKVLQEICASGAKWDDDIPDSICVRWKKWLSLVIKWSDLVIPRCYKPDYMSSIRLVEIHHFSDASNRAFGQCSYVRFVDSSNRVWCSLLMGKSRVCPAKIVSVPILELSAALLSLKISLFMKKELEYTNAVEHFWSDSTVTLSYIKSEANRFHTFVANRVQQIRDNSQVSSWKYVPTAQNPADDASRGLDPCNVDSESRWFRSPEFLWNKYWHGFEVGDISLEPDDVEVRKTVFHTSVVEQLDILLCLSTISSWFRIRRIVVIWRVYIRNLQRKVRHSKIIEYSTASVEDLQSAEFRIIRLVQLKHFSDELHCLSQQRPVAGSSKLAKLNPFMDVKCMLIRVGGRLSESGLPFQVKHPVVLPQSKECYFS